MQRECGEQLKASEEGKGWLRLENEISAAADELEQLEAAAAAVQARLLSLRGKRDARLQQVDANPAAASVDDALAALKAEAERIREDYK